MAVNKQSVSFFNFSGGLNTEATPISRGPNDAVDIENIDLDVDGSITRRRGLDFIAAKSDSTFYETSTFDYTSVFGTYVDEVPSVAIFSPVKSDGSTFTVVVAHIGNKIKIYDYENILDLANIDVIRQKFTLSEFSASQAHTKTRFAIDRNRLFIINKDIPLSYIQYEQVTNKFSYNTADIFIRNTEGNAKPDDFVRQGGKTYSCINTHVSTTDNKPGTGDNWENFWTLIGSEDDNYPTAWAAKDTTQVSDRVVITLVEVEEQELGLAAKYVCIADHTSAASNKPGEGANWEDFWEYEEDVSLGIGLAGQYYPEWSSGENYTTTTTSDTPNYFSNIESLRGDSLVPVGWDSATVSSGRFWLAGYNQEPNKIYFSQTITNDFQFNRMYQFADPLNTLDNETVDTDGGTIRITGAEIIYALAPFQGGVIVFANNGVWYVRGSGGVFKATDFSVDNVSSDGIVGPDAWASIDDKLVYFGVSNVYVIAAQDIDILPTTQVISEKISTFYSQIPLFSKQAGKAIYNPADKKLYFFTNFTAQEWSVDRNPNKQPTHFRDILILDARLKAWYKYTLSEDTVGNDVAVGDVFNIRGGSSGFATVVDNSNNLVEDELGNLVEAFNTQFNDSSILTNLLLIKKNSDNTDWAFGQLIGDTLQDFSLNTTDTESFTSFITTAHQDFGDVVHKKQSPYITTVFKRVESGVIDGITGEDITPGGCQFRTNYEYSTSSKSNKFGTLRAAYKPTRWTISYFDGSDPGIEVVKNKHKIRGRGNGLQLHFENDGDKDFKLYGFQIDVTASRKV